MKTTGRRQSSNIRDVRDPVERARMDVEYLNSDTSFRQPQDNYFTRKVQDTIRTDVNTETGFADYTTQQRMQTRRRNKPDRTKPYGPGNRPLGY